MIDRRKFIKTISMLGLSIPAMAKSVSKKSENNMFLLIYIACDVYMNKIFYLITRVACIEY